MGIFPMRLVRYLGRLKKRTIDGVATLLFLLALGTCLIMISAAIYLLVPDLSPPQFECPLTSKINCKGQYGCSICNIFNASTNDIIRFQGLPECLGKITSFPKNNNRNPAGNTCPTPPPDCNESLLGIAFCNFFPGDLEICESCVRLTLESIIQLCVSIALFPLGLLYMTCNLLSWSSGSFEKRTIPQIPKESKSDALSLGQDNCVQVQQKNAFASSRSPPPLPIIQRVEITLKGFSTLNQFFKYTA